MKTKLRRPKMANEGGVWPPPMSKFGPKLPGKKRRR